MITVIFIVCLLGSAGDGMCQRNDRRFISALVACRRIHVPKRGVRGGDTTAGADRDEGAVTTGVPWAEPVELLPRGLAERVASIINVPGGKTLLSCEARACVE